MSDDPAASAADTHRGGGDLPADLVAYRESYTEMFGTLPPLPAAKFAFTGQIAPDFLRWVEELRARAFTTEVFDPAATQLLIFAMMLATGGGAADWHAPPPDAPAPPGSSSRPWLNSPAPSPPWARPTSAAPSCSASTPAKPRRNTDDS